MSPSAEEFMRRLRRWREPLIFGGAAVVLAALALRGWSRGGAAVPLLQGLAALGAAALARVGLQKARLPGQGDGPGTVVVAERRIGYLGPLGGGFVDLDALDRIDIVSGPGGGLWRLHVTGAPPLDIPAGAEGAERLHDALASLPGIDWDRVPGHLARRRPAIVPVWEKAR
jgi:hypothetical protein